MVKPVGGFYIFACFSGFREGLIQAGLMTDDHLCERLLSDTGITMLSGSDFGMGFDQLCTHLAFVDFDGLPALSEVDSGMSREEFMKACRPKLVEACARLDLWLQEL